MNRRSLLTTALATASCLAMVGPSLAQGLSERPRVHIPRDLNNADLPSGIRADRIVVHKAARRMWLFDGTTPLREYHIALGFSPIGHKQFEGDGKTPEGAYRLTSRNPASAFHKSILINYPTPADRANARRLGRSPGGNVRIHGIGGARGHARGDWTAGCIAVSDREMDEIWLLTRHGAAIFIRA